MALTFLPANAIFEPSSVSLWVPLTGLTLIAAPAQSWPQAHTMSKPAPPTSRRGIGEPIQCLRVHLFDYLTVAVRFSEVTRGITNWIILKVAPVFEVSGAWTTLSVEPAGTPPSWIDTC